MRGRYIASQVKLQSYHWFKISMLPDGSEFDLRNPPWDQLEEVGDFRDTRLHGNRELADSVASRNLFTAGYQLGDDAMTTRMKLQSTPTDHGDGVVLRVDMVDE